MGLEQLDTLGRRACLKKLVGLTREVELHHVAVEGVVLDEQNCALHDCCPPTQAKRIRSRIFRSIGLVSRVAPRAFALSRRSGVASAVINTTRTARARRRISAQASRPSSNPGMLMSIRTRSNPEAALSSAPEPVSS